MSFYFGTTVALIFILFIYFLKLNSELGAGNTDTLNSYKKLPQATCLENMQLRGNTFFPVTVV